MPGSVPAVRENQASVFRLTGHLRCTGWSGQYRCSRVRSLRIGWEAAVQINLAFISLLEGYSNDYGDWRQRTLGHAP